MNQLRSDLFSTSKWLSEPQFCEKNFRLQFAQNCLNSRKTTIYQSLHYIFANQDRFSNALMQCTAVVWHMCIFRKGMTCRDSFLIYLYFLLSSLSIFLFMIFFFSSVFKTSAFFSTCAHTDPVKGCVNLKGIPLF